MKTFNDLKFLPIDHLSAMYQARLNFDNNYEVSVIYGQYAYGDEEHPYEVAVLKDGDLCYDTPITDDVVGYCTPEKVTEIMKQVQEL